MESIKKYVLDSPYRWNLEISAVQYQSDNEKNYNNFMENVAW